MRQTINQVLFFVGILFTLNAGAAGFVPKPPVLSAKAYLLMDYHSGKVLAQKDINKRIEPASLTKMMTAYVVDQTLATGKMHLDDKVTISKKAWKAPGSRMFVEVGKSVPLELLLKGMIIQSGNDASIALAEHVAGTETAFADLMNQYAKELGMKDTHFVNATGLPSKNHYTTAHDLALLAKALIRDFPESYEHYAAKWFNYNNIKQPNRNRLLWRMEGVDGIKTGHTESAGFCLVSSGQFGDMRLISVVVGTANDGERTTQSQAILQYGIHHFETHKVYAADQVVTQPRIWMADKPQVDVGLEEPLYVTLPHGQFKELKAKMHLQKSIKAPVEQGEQLGDLYVTLDNKVIIKRPLYALESLNKGGIWRQFSDYVSLTFHDLFGNSEAKHS